MEKIVKFPGTTTAKEPANNVLEKAKKWELDEVLIIGVAKDEDFVMGGNFSEVMKMIYLLRLADKYITEDWEIG